MFFLQVVFMIPVIDMTEPARCMHDCTIFYAGLSKYRGLRSKAEWRGTFVPAAMPLKAEMLWQLAHWVPLLKGEENREPDCCVSCFVQAEWIIWVPLWWHHHRRLRGLHWWHCRVVWAAEATPQPLQNHSEGSPERLSPWLLYWCELAGLFLGSCCAHRLRMDLCCTCRDCTQDANPLCLWFLALPCASRIWPTNVTQACPLHGG